MDGVIDALATKGFSYRMLGTVIGEPTMVIRAAKKDPNILSEEIKLKLFRLNRIVDFVLEAEPAIDPVAVFEEHIVVCHEDGQESWAYLHELWLNGSVDDLKLISILQTTDNLYSYEELVKDYPMETRVIDASDGHKSVVCEIPIKKRGTIRNLQLAQTTMICYRKRNLLKENNGY